MREIGRSQVSYSETGEKDKDDLQQNGKKKGLNKTKLIIRSLVAIVVLIIVVGMFLNIQTSGNEAPGEAPEGKVWSPDHGHWHDAE